LRVDQRRRRETESVAPRSRARAEASALARERERALEAAVRATQALWRAGQSAFGYFSDQRAGVATAEARADDLPPRAGRLGGEAHDLTVWGDHLYVADGSGSVTYALSP
jgi:hypothetical protein